MRHSQYGLTEAFRIALRKNLTLLQQWSRYTWTQFTVYSFLLDITFVKTLQEFCIETFDLRECCRAYTVESLLMKWIKINLHNNMVRPFPTLTFTLHCHNNRDVLALSHSHGHPVCILWWPTDHEGCKDRKNQQKLQPCHRDDPSTTLYSQGGKY